MEGRLADNVFTGTNSYRLRATSIVMKQLNSDGPDLKWRTLYAAAILEPDATRVRKRVEEAKHAIFDRVEDLHGSADASERRAMLGALEALRCLEGLHPDLGQVA